MSKTYVTVEGDMWDSIAYKTIGSVMYTDQVIALNPQYVQYYILPAGLEVTLPELEDTRITSAMMPPWKKVSDL